MRYVALLRGINVGTAKRVAMADLRALVEELGYRGVRTLRNSGNVVLTRSAGGRGDPGPQIERALAAKLNVSAPVLALSAKELDAIVAANPLVKLAKDPSRLLVTFLQDPGDVKRLRALAREDFAPEAIAVGAHAAYLWCPDGILDGRLWKAVERALSDGATSRNWATVLELQALVRAAV